MSCRMSSAAMVLGRIRDSAKARSSGTAGLRWWHTISMSRCSSTVLTVCGRVGLVDAGSMLGSDTAVIMSGAWPPPAPSTWKACRVRPATASKVSPTKPASFRVSEWTASWTPDSSHTSRQAEMTAGVAPQSSWILKPRTPARSWSRMDSFDMVLPLPRKPMLTGLDSRAANIHARCQAPGVTVVALLPSAGPVPPPMRVVTPDARASSTAPGAMKWTWVSIPPAVTILPLPATISVSGPMTRSGWTPSMVSGFPALPMPVIRPSRMPMSALTIPQ